MPYLKRNETNEIVGIFNCQQFDDQGNKKDYEYLDDNHNDVIEFKKKINDRVNKTNENKYIINELNSLNDEILNHLEEKYFNKTTTKTEDEIKQIHLKRISLRKKLLGEEH